MDDELKIIPRGRVVLAEPGEAPKEYTVGGAVQIPAALREKHRLVSKVLAVGPGVEDIHVGQLIFFPAYAGLEFKWEGKEYKLVREEDVFCIIRP